MLIRPVFCLLVSAFLLTTALSSVSSAQWLRSGLKGQRRPLRVLGHGYSAGYHWRNPGPNSDYYNPYSAHNSQLTSETGGSYGFFPNYGGQRYSPTGEPNYENLHGDLIEGDFQQANPNEPSNVPSGSDETTGDDVSRYRWNIAPIQPPTGSSANDFVPASHFKRNQPSPNSDWSMQDPFAHPSDR